MSPGLVAASFGVGLLLGGVAYGWAFCVVGAVLVLGSAMAKQRAPKVIGTRRAQRQIDAGPRVVTTTIRDEERR